MDGTAFLSSHVFPFFACEGEAAAAGESRQGWDADKWEQDFAL